MRSSTKNMASKSAIIGLAVVGTVLAFIIGAQAGTILNGRLMPAMGNPGSSPVHTHVR